GCVGLVGVSVTCLVVCASADEPEMVGNSMRPPISSTTGDRSANDSDIGSVPAFPMRDQASAEPGGPCWPIGPCGPCGPVAPTGPWAPVAPVAPVSPLSPFGPWGPIGPVAPAGPC